MTCTALLPFQKGMKFIMTCYEDAKATIPSSTYSYLAQSGTFSLVRHHPPSTCLLFRRNSKLRGETARRREEAS